MIFLDPNDINKCFCKQAYAFRCIYYSLFSFRKKFSFFLQTSCLNETMSLRIKTRILKGLRSFKKCSQSHVRQNEFWNE